ncbi:MAG TPA: hypothetical protein VFV19_10480 [Candidatus Polarisedimenticolaceae bacterium]|nr:hypothetical protein [Candidatus Polarisedimenticolaceae bacterium]
MKAILSTLALCLLLASTSHAGMCPADKVIPGPSERTVAGFDIKRDTMSAVDTRMGKPQKSKYLFFDRDAEGQQWVKHKWTRGETALGVSGHGDRIEILQISSDRADATYASGRGLRLGDARKRVEALYGTTFVDGHVTGPEIGERTVTYCYDDGIELSVGYDSADSVTAIRVTNPIARVLSRM